MPVTWITIAPTNPTSQTRVTVALEWYGCYRGQGFERTGNTFFAYYDRSSRCTATGPGGTSEFPVGILDAGPYTVRYELRVDGMPEGLATLAFNVAAAPAAAPSPAPAMAPWSGCALALALLVGAGLHWFRTAR
jgi:hypothetical protein